MNSSFADENSRRSGSKVCPGESVTQISSISTERMMEKVEWELLGCHLLDQEAYFKKTWICAHGARQEAYGDTNWVVDEIIFRQERCL